MKQHRHGPHTEFANARGKRRKVELPHDYRDWPILYREMLDARTKKIRETMDVTRWEAERWAEEQVREEVRKG